MGVVWIFLEFLDFFFGIFVILGISFWLLNNCFELLKIIDIVEKFRNRGIISNLLIYEISRIFGIFLVILL